MARQLFGTDGIRGRAGHFLSAELALGVARAAVSHSPAERPQVLIVRDTRESGEMLESALAAGVSAGGGDALLGGVLPTPAAPLLVRRDRKSTRLNSSHEWISYAVFCLKKKKKKIEISEITAPSRQEA